MQGLKKSINIILLVILIIQCAYMIYWGMQKSGYYVDEFFTYDNAHYISASTPKREKLYDAEFMEYDKWFDVSELKGTLTVQRDESLFNDSLVYNIKQLITKKPYMALLNYVEAVFFDGKLNWWSAISLNIVLYIINQLLVYAIVMKVNGNKISAYLSMALYGFSGMAVSMLVYVRFYMFVTMMVSLFTYLHVLMWYGSDYHKNIACEIMSMLVVFMSFKMSPISAIYTVTTAIGFSVALLIKKRVKQALYYTVPILGGGGLYAVFMTDYVRILLKPQKALDNGTFGVAINSLIGNMLKLDAVGIINRAEEFMHMVCRFLFGHVIILFIYVLLFAILLFENCIIRKKPINNIIKEEKNIPIVGVMLASVLAYIIGSIIFRLSSTTRYNSFIFPIIAILIVMAIMSLVHEKKTLYIVVTILSLAIIGEVYYTYSVPRIENLYAEEKNELQSISSYNGINSVVVDYGFDDRVMYECLAYTDDNTKVMFTSYGETDYGKVDNIILLWQTVNQSFDVYDDLVAAGYYSIEEIAKTHESVVYICRR